jgi:hypothetical protein
MTVDFIYDKTRLVEGKAAVNRLRITVDEQVHTNIPKEIYEDRLALHRLVLGESIDGLRTEKGPYFVPDGIVSATNPNLVSFGYRQVLPPDSLYDVYIVVKYLGSFENDGPEFRSLQHPANLRSIQINRVYLAPEELEQRRLVKRQKYGEMNLCTGMPCPETGLWEGWTENGATDMLVVRKGDAFQHARLSSNVNHRDWYRFASARWMWLKDHEAFNQDG